MRVWKPTSGTPQGGVISPLLANLYLHRLDVLMAERGLEMVRYADDFVILCRSMAEAQAALETVRGFADENGLTLHPDKTHIGDCRIKGQGFEFLGYRFGAGRRLVRKKSLLSLRERIRERTRRTSAASLERVIASLNPMLKGWFEYFKHATHGLQDVDAFIRRRLRAMLRKQDKRPRPRTVANGRTLSSQKPGCSPWKPPGELRDAPDEETLDRRAVCGKTARTVRREGRRKRLPYPYQRWHHTPPHQAKQRRLRRNVVTTRPSIAARLDCFASLAMTAEKSQHLLRCRLGCSPNPRDAEGVEDPLVGDKRQAFRYRLCDEQSVEGIAARARQRTGELGMGESNRQFQEFSPLRLCCRACQPFGWRRAVFRFGVLSRSPRRSQR